jgi:hypothetical protein
VYLFNHKENTITPQVAQNTEQAKPDSNKSTSEESNDPVVEDIDPQYGKMVAQFTSLIETKQDEIKAIEKDNPTLYHQFSGDIKGLIALTRYCAIPYPLTLIKNNSCRP